MRQGTTSQAAEKLISEPPQASGHDFSRAISAVESTRALAPAVCFSGISPQNQPFSAACSVVPQMANFDSGFSRR
jgi:hypothetical protein